MRRTPNHRPMAGRLATMSIQRHTAPLPPSTVTPLMPASMSQATVSPAANFPDGSSATVASGPPWRAARRAFMAKAANWPVTIMS